MIERKKVMVPFGLRQTPALIDMETKALRKESNPMEDSRTTRETAVEEKYHAKVGKRKRKKKVVQTNWERRQKQAKSILVHRR